MAAKLRSKTRNRAFATSDMAVKQRNADGTETLVAIVSRRKPRATVNRTHHKITKTVKVADVLKMRDTMSLDERRRINGV